MIDTGRLWRSDWPTVPRQTIHAGERSFSVNRSKTQ